MNKILCVFTRVVKACFTNRSSNKGKLLCVFAGASEGKTALYEKEVHKLAAMLATRDFRFTYGGGRTGLMGAFADSAVANDAHVTGIIPEFLKKLEIANTNIQSLKIVDTMHKRKTKMYDGADGFIVLPGGLGTMDEWMEVMTWNQLGLIQTPIFVLNVKNYWQTMLHMIDHANKEGFVHHKGVVALHIAQDSKELVDLIDQHICIPKHT